MMMVIIINSLLIGLLLLIIIIITIIIINSYNNYLYGPNNRHGGSVACIACTAASQQEGHGFDSRTGRCWLWGAGPPQSAQCSGGLSPWPFCVEFACSPRVHKGFPPVRTPTEKTCKITEHMSIP